MANSPNDEVDVLAGTLEAIVLEQAQLPWQSRVARWQYRQEHVAALLPDPEPEPEPEPEQEQEQESEQEQEQEERTIRTLGGAQVAATRAAEATRRIQTAHMDRYGSSWRDQRLFTVPGRAASLLQRETPLPSFSIWRAEQVETLVIDALCGDIGPTVERMRQQEELLLSRVNALEGAAELGQWCGKDVNDSLALAEPLCAALRAVQEQLAPHIHGLADNSECEAQVSSSLRVLARPEVTHSPEPAAEPPDWSAAEQVLRRAAQQLETARAAAQAQVRVEPGATMEALGRQAEQTAWAKATERSERLYRRDQQLQRASVRWRQGNEFLPADVLLGSN
jgi:hypothetical protein